MMLRHRGGVQRGAAAAAARGCGCRTPTPTLPSSFSFRVSSDHRARAAGSSISNTTPSTTTSTPKEKTAATTPDQTAPTPTPTPPPPPTSAMPTTPPSPSSSPPIPPLSLPPIPYAQVLLVQTFGWDSHKTLNGRCFWRRLADLAPRLAALGATHAWLPPPSASVSPEGYLPGQLYDLNSKFGSPDDLRACCSALKANGIRPIADIVINHRCADRQDEHGRWNVFLDTGVDGTTTAEEEDGNGNGNGSGTSNGGRPDSRNNRRRIDWGRWAVTGNDPHFGGHGNADSGADFEGAPDLDHHNPELRDALVEWLLWLREDFGFEGWRLDFAKGYAAQYSGEYIRRTLPRTSAEGDSSSSSLPFCVGELWCDLAWAGEGKPAENQDPARQALCDWVDGVRAGGGDAAAFDFVGKGLLQAALASGELWRLKDGQGKAAGLSGWWPDRSVAFADNHDTGSAQRHWPCPSRCLQAAHAYILTHPAIPCLFAEHVFDAGFHAGPTVEGAEALSKAIDALLGVRRDCGIAADASLEILAAEQGLYVADVGGATATARVKLGEQMEMGALLPKEEEGWRLAASGEGFAVWTRRRDEAGAPSAR